MMTTPFPEPESPELERFTMYSRAEIVATLRQLSELAVPVTAYIDVGGSCAVTAVLAVKPDFEELILDDSADAELQRRLLASTRIVFVAFHELVKLQFAADIAEAVIFEGRSAFRVRLPTQLLRLQRRDFFRVKTPISKPATCLVPYAADAQQYERLQVIDISIGGVAVLTYPERFDLPRSGTVENCFLDLPGIGSFHVGLRVQHVDPIPRDEKARRCGCEFVDMAPASRVMLQRYINKIDGEQRKVAGTKRAA